MVDPAGWTMVECSGIRRQLTNSLHPSIQASTLVGRAAGPVVFCTLCREPDHTSDQCDLQSPASHLTPVTTSPSLTSSLAMTVRSRVQFRQRPESLAGICVSWNKGNCSFPNTCKYRHICATCQQHHMAWDCVTTPRDSEYKNVGHYLARGKPTSYSRLKPLP